MKKLLIVLVLAAFIGGCNGVWTNAEYSQLLDKTAALSDETAKRAESGQMPESQMIQALRSQADTWAKFKSAKDGVK